jgi:hypothetical protein
MEQVVLCAKCGNPERCLGRFRSALVQLDLEITLDSTLASIPGSIHLHLRPKAERTGTLEYTMNVRDRQAWLSWHSNRHRPWVDAVVKSLSTVGCGP